MLFGTKRMLNPHCHDTNIVIKLLPKRDVCSTIAKKGPFSWLNFVNLQHLDF